MSLNEVASTGPLRGPFLFGSSRSGMDFDSARDGEPGNFRVWRRTHAPTGHRSSSPGLRRRRYPGTARPPIVPQGRAAGGPPQPSRVRAIIRTSPSSGDQERLHETHAPGGGDLALERMEHTVAPGNSSRRASPSRRPGCCGRVPQAEAWARRLRRHVLKDDRRAGTEGEVQARGTGRVAAQAHGPRLQPWETGRNRDPAPHRGARQFPRWKPPGWSRIVTLAKPRW